MPSVALQETLTNNVNLQPSGQAKGDLVTELTPQLTISEKGARSSLQGSIAAPIVLYARTGSENNTVYPSVNLIGNVEAVEKFFYLDGAVQVSQQFLTPFAATPASLANATDNRYTSSSYRVTPYIQGVTSGGTRYELRNNNVWTNLSGAPIATNNAYYDEWKGTVASLIAPFGWSVDGDWNSVKFNDQEPMITALGRGRLFYQADPQLRFDVDGGYEDNRYPFSDYRGAIYGAGIQWNPTPRTRIVGNWEHRFFGGSYLFTLDHRSTLSSVNLLFSRNITSYPQQFLGIPATGNVQALLNQILTSRIPDATQRQDFINQLITDRGLPSSLSGPVNLYTQQIALQENASITFGILGARNNIFLTAFRLYQEPIAGSGTPLPPGLASVAVNDNTQSGGSLTWTHNLTPRVTLNVTATGLQTVANSPLVGKTNQGIASLSVTAPLSTLTSLFAGARYQALRSDVTPDYNEVAAFAGFNYMFK